MVGGDQQGCRQGQSPDTYKVFADPTNDDDADDGDGDDVDADGDDNGDGDYDEDVSLYIFGNHRDHKVGFNQDPVP